MDLVLVKGPVGLRSPNPRASFKMWGVGFNSGPQGSDFTPAGCLLRINSLLSLFGVSGKAGEGGAALEGT